jgi:glycosyltransferase involved in cell wall biosynthesis
MLINAVNAARSRTEKRIVYLFVGDGVSRAPCENLVRSLGFEADVMFLGSLEHARVPDIMAASDIFVSTSELTNVAIPTCEAMVCGLPVIGFDVGNTREIVRDGETGLVVADGNVDGLGEAIAGLADDDERRRRMGDASKRLALETFTGWDERTRSELDIINRIIDRHRSAGSR